MRYQCDKEPRYPGAIRINGVWFSEDIKFSEVEPLINEAAQLKTPRPIHMGAIYLLYPELKFHRSKHLTSFYGEELRCGPYVLVRHSNNFVSVTQVAPLPKREPLLSSIL